MQPSQTVLDLNGLTETGAVHRNLPVARLVEISLRRNESSLASTGALVALTGKRTGRSPGDKFVVREPSSEARIWWGKVNQPMSREEFQKLRAKVSEHFRGRDVDRKSTRLNSSHSRASRMPSSA